MNAILCPCCSFQEYSQCCKRFHCGENSDSPLSLMRARYSAYCLQLPLFIQKTTHPKSPHFIRDRVQWEQDIREFCQRTQFIRLEIFSYGKISSDKAWVHFSAHLMQRGRPLQMIEKSGFEHIHGYWTYTQDLNLEL